ncbi:hypothetical protein ACQPZ8_28570 [Actinomadura nitritigenes]|uniref:hypothetical protein n=1 Tax=Actinomadura nitritigenes TaxID=134602 RepID=UPI003D8E468E
MDVSTRDAIVTGNQSIGNNDFGLFFEISSARLTGNFAAHNGVGIGVANFQHAYLSGNILLDATNVLLKENADRKPQHKQARPVLVGSLLSISGGRLRGRMRGIRRRRLRSPLGWHPRTARTGPLRE